MNHPGHYFIKVINNVQPVLHRGDGVILDDHTFEAKGKSLFTFEIQNLDPPPIVRFAHPSITWFTPDGQQPPHIHHQVDDDGALLDLKVNPPVPLPPEHVFSFRFNFDNGEGLEPLDPTIVEKPPDE